MTASLTQVPHGEPGSLTGVPQLPEGLTDTFWSVMVKSGETRLHAVVGGEGPPVLLVGGWPQTWYAWRLVMGDLAESHTVVVAEYRGVGLSDKPAGGYDTATLAGDLVALMRTLGHERFAMVGHDIGMWIGYALAADHPETLTRLALMEAAIPGISPSAPLLGPSTSNDRLWHFAFNRLPELNEQLVEGREHLFYPHQFASKAAAPTSITGDAVRTYVDSLARSRDALRASFEPYRALDVTIAQNEQRRAAPITLPVLALAGEANLGDLMAQTMAMIATNVRSVVLADVGHYPAEEDPGAVLGLLLPFLAE